MGQVSRIREPETALGLVRSLEILRLRQAELVDVHVVPDFQLPPNELVCVLFGHWF